MGGGGGSRGSKLRGGSGWGVRVAVNEELKFLGKFKKKSGERGSGGGWFGEGGGG